MKQQGAYRRDGSHVKRARKMSLLRKQASPGIPKQ
jgi:hypothetical protein